MTLQSLVVLLLLLVLVLVPNVSIVVVATRTPQPPPSLVPMSEIGKSVDEGSLFGRCSFAEDCILGKRYYTTTPTTTTNPKINSVVVGSFAGIGRSIQDDDEAPQTTSDSSFSDD